MKFIAKRKQILGGSSGCSLIIGFFFFQEYKQDDGQFQESLMHNIQIESYKRQMNTLLQAIKFSNFTK